jgi:succinate dehydrogenase/fumarate reductase flavoprotein subunit
MLAARERGNSKDLLADVVVVGSGAGGLTAALTAALGGARVVLLEHSDKIGGTSARSSGTVWIPDNPYLREAGIVDDRAKAKAYLGSLVSNKGSSEIWEAFLDHGPEMIADIRHRAGVGFRPIMTAPDYRQDHPGAAAGGRPLEPLPFSGRKLGEMFARVAPPLPELMFFGGMMVTRAEAQQLLRADRSLSALALGVRLTGRYAIDRLAHRRGTRLVLGNALVARLLKAALDHGVQVMTDVAVERLQVSGSGVAGLSARCAGSTVNINARCGIVLAGGGFPSNPALRAKHLPAPVAEYTPAYEGCDGSTIQLAQSIGAALGPSGVDNALWFPSSISKRRDGSTAVYPHIVLDRAKPGLIAVDRQGERFTNEAASYHEFVRAMYRVHESHPTIPAWLICDGGFIRKYGLGLIRPRTWSVRRFVESGHLIEGQSPDELASKAGFDSRTFSTTLRRYNSFCLTGKDLDFAKGETIYDRNNGDLSHGPNPCVGPIEGSPLYALAVYPTPLGTSRGLAANRFAQVCDVDGNPLSGLYVCGNDMQSVFGGEYPGAGGQLGQAMTFGWIAANHALGVCI